MIEGCNIHINLLMINKILKGKLYRNAIFSTCFKIKSIKYVSKKKYFEIYCIAFLICDFSLR